MSVFSVLNLPFESIALAFLKGALILLLAVLLVLLLKRTAAATRHWVLMTGVALLLGLPLLTQLFPKWQVELASPLSLPASNEVVNENLAATFSVADPFFPTTEWDVFTTEAVPTSSALPATWYDSVQHKLASLHWTEWVAGIWFVGLLLCFSWILLGILGVFYISSKAEEVKDTAWTDLAEELVDRFYLRRNVRLLQTTRTLMPVTWGFFRPIILLPIEAETWSEERRRYVLTHEFAHIARWDCLTQLFSQFALAVHWFNPLVWWTNRRLRLEQEKACDDRVIQMGLKPSVYAQHLLDIARSVQASWISPISAVAMARPSQLEGRLLSILNGKKDPEAARKNRIVATSMILLMVVPLIAFTPVQPKKAAYFSFDSDEATALSEAYEKANRAAEVIKEQEWNAIMQQYERALQHSDMLAREFEAEKALNAAIKQLYAAQNKLESSELEISKKRLDELVAKYTHSSEDASDEEKMYADLLAQEYLALATKVHEASNQNSIETTSILELTQDTQWNEANPFFPIYSPQDTTDEDREKARKRAAEAARNALNDTDEQVRYQALQSLYRIMPEGSTEDFARVLREDDSPTIRRFAAKALTRYGSDEGVEALVEALADEDVVVRRTAATGLNYVDSREASEALARTITSDDDYRVRMAAMKSLARLDGEAYQDVFRGAMEDNEAQVRMEAVKILYRLEGVDRLELLSGVLIEDEDPKVRTFAARALGQTRDIQAVDALSEAMNDESPEVRKAAAQALQALDYDGTGRANRFNLSIDADNWDEFADQFEAQLAVPLADFGHAAGKLALSTSSQVLEGLSEITGEMPALFNEEVAIALEEARFELEDELRNMEDELEALSDEMNYHLKQRRQQEARLVERKMQDVKIRMEELQERRDNRLRVNRFERFPERRSRTLFSDDDNLNSVLASLEKHLKAANMPQVREQLFFLGDREIEEVERIFTEYVANHAGGVECEEALEALASSNEVAHRELAEKLSCEG